MITSYRQLLEETIAKFEAATSLNKLTIPRDSGGPVCFYAPINEEAPGCAIGCHMPIEDARFLDKTLLGPTGITTAFRHFPEIVNRTFDAEAIGLPDLSHMQALHDSAMDVDDFLSRLREELERLL